jgi:hypothetical protein
VIWQDCFNAIRLPLDGEYGTRAFLNHSGGHIMDHYIRNSALGELQLAEQETISAHLVRRSGGRGWLV